MSKYQFDASDVSSLFKTVYGPLADATFNTSFAAWSRIKQIGGFGGTKYDWAVPLTFGGSVGAGSLPLANTAQWATATISRKKVYGRLMIDRETMKIAQTDKDAFIRGTKEYVRKVVESYTRNAQRILFGNGDGSLGTVASSSGSGTTSSPYLCVISDATWKLANWEEADYVNVGTGTDVYEVVSVAPATKTIGLVCVTGTPSSPGTNVIYMQGSKDADPFGLKQVCDATVGSPATLYGVTVGRRWQAYQKAAGSAGISVDILNEAVLSMQETTGKIPTEIVMSFKQFRKMLDLLEDAKVYDVRPRDENYKASVSFPGVQFMSSAGVIPMYPERFVEDDRVYLLNTNYIEMRKAEGFGWFDDDGTVLLRMADEDAYEARYGGYWNIFINPAYQGVISGLA